MEEDDDDDIIIAKPLPRYGHKPMKVLNYIVLSPMIRKTAGVGYQIDSPLSMIRKNCWYWIPNRFSVVHRRLCAGRSKLTKPRF